MKNQQILAALSMDLRRAALGYHRGSRVMAKRFWLEAMKRRQELDVDALKPYLQQCLKKLDKVNLSDSADELLTYSILFQNAAQTVTAD